MVHGTRYTVYYEKEKGTRYTLHCTVDDKVHCTRNKGMLCKLQISGIHSTISGMHSKISDMVQNLLIANMKTESLMI